MPCNRIPAVDGEFGLVYGTSASAPVFGSIITLLNDARLAIGKRPVGFINPIVCLLVAFPKRHAQFTN
jgi:tripeptidyl-peptidase-1